MIYADNAATTKMSETAIKAMMPYIEEYYGNASSLYEFGQKAKKALDKARSVVADCIGAEPREIYFTSGGSEADNQAIISAAMLGKKKGKKHIISTAFEHHAVLHTLEILENEGFEITLLDVHSNGIVTSKQVGDAIREDTCLVTIMYANNEIGTIQPIAEIGAVCKSKGVLFHTDAVQAVGHIDIDVKKENIDLLSMSAHKFGGAKGAGALYARKSIVLTSLINGGAQERSKRAGTENVPAIVSMSVAIKEACRNIENHICILTPLRDKLIDGLNKISYSELNGDKENRLANNVNFCFEGIEGETLLLLLDDKGICASSGSACTSGSLDPSHVLLAIGRSYEVARGALRLSIGDDITENDVDYIINSVTEIVTYLRNMSSLWNNVKSGKLQHILSEG